MPPQSPPPWKRGQREDPEEIRCIAVVGVLIHGQVFRVQCERDCRHRPRWSGHLTHLNLVDDQGTLLKKDRGRFARVKVMWMGDSEGYGVQSDESREYINKKVRADGYEDGP